MAKFTREDALEYHRLKGKPGKVAIVPTKPMDTQRDLSLAYSPGVAEPVLEIEKNPEDAYEYTSKGNLVAVVSNGTAILGLGDRGALASKPVMEGKGVLFKKFADIDVFDIELNSHDPDEIIKVVAAISPTFGGINLEDIKAPECFYIEETLKGMLDIPVFHDDQHGTAIISSAGLANALEIVGKKHEEIRLVISGAGASAISCAELAIRWGVKRENIMLVDTKGVVYKGRTVGMNKYKDRLAVDDKGYRTLADAVQGADVFYGLSVANVLTPEMVKSMADDPVIFAMANPDPEIKPELAREARSDVIIATGRSDYVNQVNNVLGFPFIFRGALDVRARQINEEMKFAASKALAALAKEDVPDSVIRAYGGEPIKFGREYIIPKPLDPRVLLWEAPAVAGMAMETGIARKTIDIDEYRQQLAYRQGKGEQVRYFFQNKARTSGGKKRVVFAEGEEQKIIRAAFQVKEEGIATPILIGNPKTIQQQLDNLGLSYKPEIVDNNHFDLASQYATAYYELRNRKGLTMMDAVKKIREPNVLGPMMVKCGDADAFVSGLTYDYPDVIRPALQIHHTANTARAAGVYIMIVEDRVYLFTDATVNIEPSAEDLYEIACLAADFARRLEIEPRVAFLSFSNFGSTPHPLSDKVRKAVELTKSRRPDLPVDGEMQADTAVVTDIIESRYPFSAVKDANVLVFPSLESANIAYKLLANLGKAKAIGPILLGMGAPVHVLQTGDDVNAIVQIASVAVMDVMGREEAK
jgi:malate dehydrogenase (oxaloacetate-decarboxylating)(NADP+)